MGTPDGRPWIEVGTDIRVAYVFSCPGHDELIEKHPAAGQTGNHLDKVIAYLHAMGLDWIPNREKATITNAWSRVEHTRTSSPMWTGRTQGTESDVLQPTNLGRLERELAAITDWIICFGDCACWAVAALKSQNRLAARAVYVRHPSHMSLIHVNNTLDGTLIDDIPKGKKRDAKIAVVAAEIAQQLGHRPEGVQLPGDSRIDPYVLHGVDEPSRTDEVWLRHVAGAFQEVLMGTTRIPQRGAHTASVGLVMVLEALGLAAWTIRGHVHLDRAIPAEGADAADDHYEWFGHWWVESCGIWLDLTFDQFRDGLLQPPPSIGLWRAGDSAHHVPGVDDQTEMNEMEQELRADTTLRSIAQQVIEHMRHNEMK
ncbi:hypothetical protein ACN469_24900 [Corallococcus terminator]